MMPSVVVYKARCGNPKWALKLLLTMRRVTTIKIADDETSNYDIAYTIASGIGVHKGTI